eukprot:4207092-Pyramimonas_sp.AAC.1
MFNISLLPTASVIIIAITIGWLGGVPSRPRFYVGPARRSVCPAPLWPKPVPRFEGPPQDAGRFPRYGTT